MNNLLELEENKGAVSIAAPCDYIGLRKELYIKALILLALKNATGFIKTESSLFYSHKFYSFARIFDFYINNNVFDLLVLKPKSNELLFEIDNEDIHSNLHGYIVARLNSDIKQTEILGFFLSKDFDKIIKDNTVDTTALKDINLLKDIDMLEAQMSLEDVSDRFFELLSEFLDGDIDEQNSSELACLLYNSAELRHAFFEIAQFDKTCAVIATNQDCFPADFLNENSENREESAFSLEDLALSDEDIPLEQADLEEIVEKEQENAQMEEFELQDEFDISELETPEMLEEDGEFDTLEDFSNISKEEDELKLDFAEVPPDTITSQEENTDELETFELDLEELDEKEPENIEEPANTDLEQKLTKLRDAKYEKNELEDVSAHPQNEQENNTHSATNTSETELSLISLDELGSNRPEPVEPVQPSEELYSAAATQETIDIADLDDLESLEKTTANEQNNNEEIMNLLEDSIDENVVVDDAELLSILGVDSDSSLESVTAPELSVPDTINSNNSQFELSDDELSEQLDTNIYEMEEISPNIENEELKYLYTEENIPADATFPGDSIVKTSSSQISAFGANKKKVIVIAAVFAMLFAVGGGAMFMINKNSSTNNDIASDLPLDADTNPEDNLTIPPPQSANDIDSTASIPADTAVESNSTRIVSSLSSQANAAPVILKEVQWQVPTSISNDAVFNKYLQIAGKIIKTNLASDLLNSNDFAYNDKIKVSMTVKNNAPVKNVKVIESSGSKEVDGIVLQSIKETLKYINTPVMSVDTSNKDVVLVISI